MGWRWSRCIVSRSLLNRHFAHLLFDGCLLKLVSAAGPAADEERSGEAEYSDECSENPGTFFQHIRGLTYTNHLITNTSKGAGQTTPFRVLDQNEKA